MRSGVNWMRLNWRSSALAIGLNEEGFGKDGYPYEQGMSLAKNTCQHKANDFILTNDHAGNFFLQLLKDSASALAASTSLENFCIWLYLWFKN